TVDAQVYVVDCITLWVNNLLYHHLDIDTYVDKLITSLTGKEIFVTNEVGGGIIPDNALARQYIDAIGKINRVIAQKADTVYLMISGIPLRLK
ncbi:MAG: bifunctional adenosylcobinamide kinase/adenosylcobinamide-phosphate guanylyltransferase, partial [Endomicrobiales bacterium]